MRKLYRGIVGIFRHWFKLGRFNYSINNHSRRINRLEEQIAIARYDFDFYLATRKKDKIKEFNNAKPTRSITRISK